MNETDELLTWLQQRCLELKKDIEHTVVNQSTYVLQGQLNAFRDVIAFVQTKGQLR